MVVGASVGAINGAYRAGWWSQSIFQPGPATCGGSPPTWPFLPLSRGSNWMYSIYNSSWLLKTSTKSIPALWRCGIRINLTEPPACSTICEPCVVKHQAQNPANDEVVPEGKASIAQPFRIPGGKIVQRLPLLKKIGAQRNHNQHPGTQHCQASNAFRQPGEDMRRHSQRKKRRRPLLKIKNKSPATNANRIVGPAMRAPKAPKTL